MTLIVVTVLLFLLAACGGGPAAPTVTPLPSLTPTPRSTALPPVATEQALGSADRPYQVVLVPPENSSATGTALETFLTNRTGETFKVQIASGYGDVLSALCSDVPTFGWLDGLSLLAAEAQGCSTPALRIKIGTGADASTGVRADLVVRSASKITAISGLKDRDFCRLNAQDTISWVLPVMLLRSGGVNPFTNLHSVKDYADTAAMLQAVDDGVCIAAGIPAGTLTRYQVTDKGGETDITKLINPLGPSSPELSYGGLMVSNLVPKDLSDTVTRLFLDNPDQLKNLVTADGLLKASSSDFGDMERLIQSAGMDLQTLGN